MADNGQPATTVERSEDFGKGPEADIRRWLTELKLARKGHYDRWLKRYKAIVKRYRDEMRAADNAAGTGEDAAISTESGFNLLWSNVRTTAPAIYSKAPKVIVERRHKDESLVARAACIILQRSLGYQMRLRGDQFHEMMKACRLDFQLGGFAESLVKYKRVGKGSEGYSDLSTPLKAPPDGVKAWENVVREEICFDLVHPEDFLCSAGRTWTEVTWVAFAAYMTREQIEKTAQFGDERRRRALVEGIEFNSKPEGMTDEDAEKPENGVFMRAKVWAIWDKNSRRIIYVCETYTESVLGEAKDPSSLEDFFPCPQPARGTRTNNTIWPVPDYVEYGAQAREVDELSRRADAVLDSIRVAGTYDASFDALKQLLDGGYENKLIPIDTWQELSEKGGLEGAMDFLPIDQYAKVLEILFNARVVAKGDADQMSGVFDVMRGSADPNEKLGTQKLKAGYGEQRSSEPKDEMAAFARNTLAIAGELIAEHFSPASLWQMSDFETWWKGQKRGLEAKAKRMMAPPPQAAGMPPAAPMASGMPAPGLGVPPGLPIQPPGVPGAPAAPAGPSIPSGGAALPPMPAPGPGPGGPAGAPPVPGAPAPMPPLPSAEEIFLQAVELLRDEKLRGFIITIETNSTIEPDTAVDQQRRVQFLETTAVFMEKALVLGAQLPEAVPVIAQMLLFAIRGFDVGRELETVFEVFLDRMTERAANPPPKPPSPEELKAKSEQAKIEADAAAQARQAQADQAKLNAELEMARETHRMDMERMEKEMELAQVKLRLAMQEAQLKLQLQTQTNEIKLQGEQNKAAMQERQMVRDDQRAEREDAMAERSMEREEGHQERMMQAKEKQAAKPPAKK